MVECSPGERLSLPPQLPAASMQAAALLPHVDLWCNDNSLGTFWASTAQHPAPERSVDLRSPLGITPAALLTLGAAEEVAWAAPASRHQDVAQPAAAGQAAASLRKQQDAGEMFRQFQSTRRELRTELVSRLVTPSGRRGSRAGAGRRWVCCCASCVRCAQIPCWSPLILCACTRPRPARSR